ncbi:MAG: formyltransferase family protein [Alphaproteobacteria bacterium]
MKKVSKIAYCGFDFFAGCLEALIKVGYDVRWLFIAERDNKYEFNDMVLKIAAENNIEVIRERIGTEHLKRLVDEGCDVVVSAAYPYKIPTPEEAPCIINIHPEMLPRGRSPWPLPQVILNNLQVSGITIHKVTAEMDGETFWRSRALPSANATIWKACPARFR